MDPRVYLAFPYRVDRSGRTHEATLEAHVAQMIEQVLFTEPGERVNRPDFGCGLQSLVFHPSDDAVAAATQFLIHGALQRWLREWIQVRSVHISPDSETLTIEVEYTMLHTGAQQQRVFRAGGHHAP